MAAHLETKPSSKLKPTLLLLAAVALLAGTIWLVRSLASANSQERTADTIDEPRPSPTTKRAQPSAVRSALGESKKTKLPQEKLLFRAPWGSGSREVGRRKARESNPEAPMSLIPGANGGLLLLDQVNQRILRRDAQGRDLAPVPIGSTTAQDIALSPNGDIAVLDRIGKNPSVEVRDSSGKLKGRFKVVGGRITKGGGITGLFYGPGGIYAENDSDDLVLVADKDGKQTDLEQVLPGRPTRDGKQFIKAGIASRKAGKVYVQSHDIKGALLWEVPLTLDRPVLQILLLASDSSGRIYLGAEVGREDPQTQKTVDQATAVQRLSRLGKPDGVLLLPASTTDPAETYRPLSVSPDGVVYQMLPSALGVTVTAYRFR